MIRRELFIDDKWRMSNCTDADPKIFSKNSKSRNTKQKREEKEEGRFFHQYTEQYIGMWNSIAQCRRSHLTSGDSWYISLDIVAASALISGSPTNCGGGLSSL